MAHNSQVFCCFADILVHLNCVDPSDASNYNFVVGDYPAMHVDVLCWQKDRKRLSSFLKTK